MYRGKTGRNYLDLDNRNSCRTFNIIKKKIIYEKNRTQKRFT